MMSAQSSVQYAYYWSTFILLKCNVAFLFPSELELLNLPPDGVFVTQIFYGVLQDHMTLLVKDVLRLSGISAKVGLYLL